jgi:hypothetical protein
VVNSEASLHGRGEAVSDAIGKVRGQRYQSVAPTGPTAATFSGWICLRFTVTDPRYYMYD